MGFPGIFSASFPFTTSTPPGPTGLHINWTTPQGQVLAQADPVALQVSTDSTITLVRITLSTLDGDQTLVYDGSFTPEFSTSTVTTSPTLYSFSIQPTQGWQGSFLLIVEAEDSSPNSLSSTSFFYAPTPTQGSVLTQYVESVQSLSQYIVRLKLSIPVLVDQNYLDPTNYLFTQYDTDQNNVLAKEVINPFQANSSKHTGHSDEILIVTSKHNVGKVYTVEVRNLLTVDSTTLTGPADYPARFTKVDSMLTNFSGFYDTRPTAVLGTVMRAIAREDDIIGGAYYDHVLPKRDYMPSNVLTLNGQPLTLNGQYLVL